MRILIISIILIIQCKFVFPQSYNIEIEVNNLKDAQLFLGYHYGEKNYFVDTIMLDNNGKGYFSGTKDLNCGIYFVAFPNYNYFDILIDAHPFFSIKSDTSDYIFTLEFENSDINSCYVEYQKEILKTREKADFVSFLLDNYKNNTDSVNKYLSVKQDLNNEMYRIKSKYISDHREDMLGQILVAMQNPEIPVIPDYIKSDEQKNDYLSCYFKSHFFDMLDFSNPCLMRTSIIPSKLKYYLSYVVESETDSLRKYIPELVSESARNIEIYKFVLSYLLSYFELSGKHPDEKIFVEIAEKFYFNDNNNLWSPEFIEQLKTRVDIIKPLMIGQKCPDVTLYDNENIAFNLSESDHSYTVLYFWDIECGHCAFYTPVIYNVYKRLRNEDIKFIAVYTEDNYENWLKFLKENSIEEWTNLYDPTGNMKLVTRFDLYKTPRVFILDKDKKIISNNIEIEEIEKYLIKLTISE